MDTRSTGEATCFIEGGPLAVPAFGQRTESRADFTKAENDRLPAHLAYELGCALARQPNTDRLLAAGVAGCRELLGAEGVALLLLDRERNELFFPYVAQEEPAVAERLGHIRFPADRGIAGHALRSGVAMRCDDVSTDARFFTGVDDGSGMRTRTILCSPLVCDQGTLGVLEAVNRCDGGLFNDGDLALLDAIARTLAYAIGRSQHLPDSPPPPEEAPIFCKEGDYWLIAFAARAFRLKDAKGLAHIARLLRYPDREVHAIELARAASTKHHLLALRDHRGAAFTHLGDAGAMLDVQARIAYQRRLEVLREDLEEASSLQDRGRAERTQQEIEFLCQELSHAVGLGGRERRASSAAERARVNVTRAIGVALRRIAANHPGLARHFARTISTGTFCTYAPDPRAPIAWVLDSNEVAEVGRRNHAGANIPQCH